MVMISIDDQECGEHINDLTTTKKHRKKKIKINL